MDILKKFKEPYILEVGCGCGTESLWMAYHGAKVVGIDIQEDRLRVARKRQEILEHHIKRKVNLTVENVSIFDISESNLFDILWLEQALHHIEPRDKAFDKIVDLVKENGFIVISEANAWNPLIQTRLFAKRGFKTIIEFEDQNGIKHAYGNERLVFSNKLCRELAKRGIAKENMRFFRLFPNVPWVDRLMKFESVIPQWAVPFFGHYNYVGKKVSMRERA
jgi:SAM-dependent methyltransferase